MSRRAPPSPPTIARAARALGVRSRYRDATGRERSVPTRSVVAVLRALGAPTASDVSLVAWLDTRRRSKPWLDPVLVAWDGGPIPLPPGALRHPNGLEIRLTLEGTRTSRTVSPRSALVSDGVAGRDRLRPGSRATLPPGYHRLAIRRGTRIHRATVISAPSRLGVGRALRRRSWGLFVPLYALRSRATWGCGDLGALRALLRWGARFGIRSISLLPLLASFLSRPFEPSPYRPVSRAFWNEVFLDLTVEPEFRRSTRVRRLVHSRSFRRALATLRHRRYVDYRGVARLKHAVLEEMRQELERHGGDRRRAFERFVRTTEELRAYAGFRAATELAPARRSRHRRAGAVEPQLGPAGEALRTRHEYAQWLMHRQLGRLRRDAARRGISLVLDLPVGVHPDGFDARADPSGFVGGVTLGSPPDPGCPAGQDWELPAPHPEGMRATAYRDLARAVRRHFEFAETLRIDHVMGFHRLFWIPEGSPAADGTYVHYRAEEIAAVLLLEASRCGATIVGEDLGTVPPVVRRDLRRYGWLGMYVAQLEWSPSAPVGRRPRAIPADVLALLGSHDQPAFATFWKESLSPSGRSFPPTGTPGAPPSGPHEAFLSGVRHLLESPAERVVFPLEDLWGETAPQNVPGTARTSAHNFDRVSRRSIEEIRRSPEISETLCTIARWAAEDDR